MLPVIVNAAIVNAAAGGSKKGGKQGKCKKREGTRGKGGECEEGGINTRIGGKHKGKG